MKVRARTGIYQGHRPPGNIRSYLTNVRRQQSEHEVLLVRGRKLGPM